MARLNYHHLYYFWTVAQEGNLTRAAALLHVSQSALSMQIKQLEESMGQALFIRQGRSLVLSEAGHIALSYANEIFRRGEELTALLRDERHQDRQLLRIGAISTLSRNFQEAFIGPLLDRPDVSLVLQSGRLDDLLSSLGSHQLDLVLANVAVRGNEEQAWRCRRIARQQVSVIGRPRDRAFRLPEDLRDMPVLLPGAHSDIRTAFELLCEQWHIQPRILAEVDDMAMLRLLARDADGVAVLPAVVVRDEIASGALVEYCPLPGVFEHFYAISVRRQFVSPLVRDLLARDEVEVMASSSPPRPAATPGSGGDAEQGADRAGGGHGQGAPETDP